MLVRWDGCDGRDGRDGWGEGTVTVLFSFLHTWPPIVDTALVRVWNKRK
jgi:hypothetical protein